MNYSIVFWRMWKLLQFLVSVPVIAAIDELGEWQVFSLRYLTTYTLLYLSKIKEKIYCVCCLLSRIQFNFL